jgi:tetratricopeptide (TPR) repeat protein
MPRHPISLPRLSWVAAPLVAFCALFAVLTLVNGSSSMPVLPGAADEGSGDLSARGDTATLIDDLREAAGAAPGDAQIQASLGDAYYQRSRETGDPGFYTRANRAYDAALVNDPDSFTALAGKATVALARHRFADGLILARRAHRLAPAVVAPYASFVDGLIENGRYAAAGRALDRMVGLKPNLAAYSRISYYRELHGDLRGAARALRLAISAGSGTVEGSAYIRSLLGDFEAMRGRYGAAELAYREALATDPAYGGALGGLALLRASRGELAPAIKALRGQVGDPPSPDALIELGELEQAAGRQRAARRHYAQGLAIEQRLLAQGAGTDAGITLNEAEHGDPERAVSLGREAWTSAPSVSSADAYSWALHRAGRTAAASRLSAEAMRLGSRDPEFLYHAGMIARAAGDEARAARLLGRLLKQSPRFSALHAPRARAALAGLRP